MRGIATIRAANQPLAKKLEDNGGFLMQQDVAELVQIDRLMLVLVRCGNGRFMCPVQDVNHFCEIIGRENSDHVRDVSLPA